MRGDATPSLDADLVVTLEVDRAWPAALVIGGAGVILLGVAVALLLGARRRKASAPLGAHSVPAAATVLPGAAPTPTDGPRADDAAAADEPTGG
jgi:hypothetical protein